MACAKKVRLSECLRSVHLSHTFMIIVLASDLFFKKTSIESLENVILNAWRDYSASMSLSVKSFTDAPVSAVNLVGVNSVCCSTRLLLTPFSFTYVTCTSSSLPLSASKIFSTSLTQLSVLRNLCPLHHRLFCVSGNRPSQGRHAVKHACRNATLQLQKKKQSRQ